MLYGFIFNTMNVNSIVFKIAHKLIMYSQIDFIRHSMILNVMVLVYLVRI